MLKTTKGRPPMPGSRLRTGLAVIGLISLIATITVQPANAGLSGIFGGGPFYKDRGTTIPEVASSGFTEAVVWNIGVDSSGDLNFNGEFPLCTNGSTSAGSTYPNFASDMSLLKQGTVRRVTFSIGSSNVGVFQNIKALVNTQGTGSGSILYKNFQALKSAIPALDAIDFDDENSYDSSSTVSFAVMLGNLGYKVMLDAYTNSSYWSSVASQINSQRPATVDGIHLQCYSGGVGNNPDTFANFGGIPVYPGLADTSDTPAQVQSAINGWNSPGGFMWIYDDFYGTAKTAQYAAAINQAAGANISGSYELINKASGLALNNPGNPPANGVLIDQETSTGASKQIWTLGPNSDGSYALTNESGALVLENPDFSTKTGTYMDEWTANGGENQHWFFSLNSDGSYTIENGSSYLVLDDPNSSNVSGQDIEQWSSNGGANQHWVLTPIGTHTAGVHLVVNQYNNLTMDDPASSTQAGTLMDQWTINYGTNQQWNVTQNSDGSYNLINGASGQYLYNPDTSRTAGLDQEQNTSNGAASEHWFVNLISNGDYNIVSASSGLVLDNPGPTTQVGSPIDTWPANLGANQQWQLHAP